MKNLAEELISYSKKDYYPFHMPGHKRNPFSVSYEPSIITDITEIEGFDNLHHAEGIIQKSQERAARLFGAVESIYSVNGSTAALLSSISACTTMGGRVLVARNCHKAVYHAIYLRKLDPIWIYPQWEENCGLNGGISPDDVDKILKTRKNIQAVIITSPTYDGIVSDVESISRTAHKYGIPLIVDEAHGAHFTFHEYFPASAIEKGADIVVESLHKTLPCMTQTAVLHRNSERISSELLHRYMGIYQSSSPSYPLMASIDACIGDLMENGKEKFQRYAALLSEFHRELENCRVICPVTSGIVGKSGIYDWDPSKIILTLKNCTMTGSELYNILLSTYHLQMEMETCSYVLGMTSIADTPEGFQRLLEAIKRIESSLCREKNGKKETPDIFSGQKPESYMAMHQAYDSEKTYVLLNKSEGRICSEFITLYPPGIPLLVPGEIISFDFINYIKQCLEAGLEIHGLNSEGKIGVIYE